MKQNYKNRGFTLIFAILIGGLLLSIGIAITNTAIRELATSSLGRESQIAFYVADSGIECALYWDIHGRDGANNFSFASPDNPQIQNAGDMACGSEIKLLSASCSVDSCTNTFEIYFEPSEVCAIVELKKDRQISEPDLNTLDSIGINDCSITDNPNRVRRLIEVQYH